MKKIRKLTLRFFYGLLAGLGVALVLYCLTMPAKPFIYVGF